MLTNDCKRFGQYDRLLRQCKRAEKMEPRAPRVSLTQSTVHFSSELSRPLAERTMILSALSQSSRFNAHVPHKEDRDGSMANHIGSYRLAYEQRKYGHRRKSDASHDHHSRPFYH